MTAAAIVTFEPDLERFSENLRSISRQVLEVLVFDNGSSNADQVEDLVRSVEHASIIRSPNNIGIAGALNAAANQAQRAGHTWLVTLDQDSVAPDGLVEELTAVALETQAAIVTPFIVDRNKLSLEEYSQLSMPRTTDYTQAARKGAITSGALTNLPILAAVGGFDERFFIDYVDYDLNQRVLLAGHRIVRANRTPLLHEVGKAAPTWLWVPRKDVDGTWRLERFYSFGHSPQRCYYKARNRVLFTRKYGRQIGLTNEGVWQIPQQMLLTFLFERHKIAKLINFVRGIRDGIRLSL